MTYSAANGLACTRCGRHFEFSPVLLGCPTCRENGQPGALAVTYAVEPADAVGVAQANGFWSQHRLLPVAEPRTVVTLGEGETPLLPLDRIAARFGIESVFGKAEFMNPTQSYKDRTNAVSVSLARQFGFDKVCCISSGNHGVSVAAYAAAAGLRALVLLSKSTPPRIIDEIRYYGADAVVIDPASAHSSVLELVERLHVEHGWFISNRNDPLPSGRRFGNPFGLEGYKTIAFEI
jgi:threonine synthase